MAGLVRCSLRCTLCQGEFWTKSEWHAHLTTEEHQVKARECVGEWAVSEEKKRSLLVLYSSFPLTGGGGGGAEQVIQHLSQDPGTFVTNFVCWEQRPHLAILQFESRLKVDEVLAKADGANVSVEGQQIQVKRASKLLQLEWKAIFPDYVEKDGEMNENEEPSGQEGGSIKRGLETLDQNAASGSAKRQKLAEEEESNPLSKSVILWRVPPIFEPSTSLSSGDDTLVHHFSQVRKAISVPDQEFEQVARICGELFGHWKNVQDDMYVKVLFQNWHLKLRNPNWPFEHDKEPYIYAYRQRRSGKQKHQSSHIFRNSKPMWLSDSEVKQMFRQPEVQTDFGVVAEFEEGEGEYVHKNTGKMFTLVTSSRYFVELKMCQLVRFMCSFDARAYPLLTLTFFWCHVNGLAFADLNEENNEHTLSEPRTLQWLVMFWLSHKKLIPTVREIQARPHGVTKEPQFGNDVGFDGDADWVQEWKSARKLEDPSLPLEEDYWSEEFILKVIQLFQEFLAFYGRLEKSRKILNTRDAELIDTLKFTSSEDPDEWTDPSKWSRRGGMTRAELAGLRLIEKKKKKPAKQKLFTISGLREEAAALYPTCNFKTKLPDWRLYMVHPFSFVCKFSMSKRLSSQLEGMRRSALRLEKFLRMGEGRGHEEALRRFGGTLEELLKVL